MFDKIDRLFQLKTKLELCGGEDKIKKHQAKGRLTARERIEMLLDKDSFTELNQFVGKTNSNDSSVAPCEGVVTGCGKIDGRVVYVYAQDFTVYGGALGELHALKIVKIMDLAGKSGVPIIGLNDSGGARIQEGVISLDGYGHLFFRNTIYSGVVPQISVIMGACAGGAVYSPALTDFVFMVKGSKMFITGPKVIEAVTKENINAEDLGGASVHAIKSGNVHFTADSEEEILLSVRRLVSFLPSNNQDKPPVVPYIGNDDWREKLVDVVPTQSAKVYDVRSIIELVVDENSFMEVHRDFARNIVVGFGHIAGQSVGIAANQPKVMAGCLDIDASDKLSRFIRFCDAFNIPFITFVDVTGFLPGTSQEHRGIVRHGAKILYAYSEATVPKISIILRKAFGGAYVALNSKSLGADLVYAWPCAEIAVMGAEGAVNVIYGREIAESSEPEAMYRDKVEEYRTKFSNPYIAAARGMVDDVIDPRSTRIRLKDALEILKNKKEQRPKRKHGNIPL